MARDRLLGANTGVPWWHGLDDAIAAHQAFLCQRVRVDIFGVRDGGTLEGTLHAPLRPDVPRLKPGQSYLLETVVRTLKVGHQFTQGTVDSNEVWLDVEATSGDRVIGRGGAMDARQEVDRESHFVNVFGFRERDGAPQSGVDPHATRQPAEGGGTSRAASRPSAYVRRGES